MSKRNRYIAEPNRNRSQTWRIVDRETGTVVRDHLLNRDSARYEALRLNLEAERAARGEG